MVRTRFDPHIVAFNKEVIASLTPSSDYPILQIPPREGNPGLEDYSVVLDLEGKIRPMDYLLQFQGNEVNHFCKSVQIKKIGNGLVYAYNPVHPFSKFDIHRNVIQAVIELNLQSAREKRETSIILP